MSRSVVLRLLWKLGLPDIGSPQFHTEHSLHGTQDLLIRLCGSSLEILHNADGGVALCGEILLAHFGCHFVAAFDDGLCDLETDGLGLDDFVGAVDFSQVLAFR